MHLASHPFQILNDDSEQFHEIQRLTVVLYDKTSASSSVNETRRNLFCHKNHAMDKLPPTTMLYFSIHDVQCFKQEFGQQAHKHNKWSLLQRILVGAKWRTHGSQCGLQFQRFRDQTGSCLNALAKETAQTAHVAKLIWIVHHCANAAAVNRLTCR